MYEKFAGIIPEIKTIENIYFIEEADGHKIFRDFLDLASDDDFNEIDKIANTIDPDDLATIIYTSGTTGTPKGVMLSHKNYLSNIKPVSDILTQNMVQKIISFLPLCHVYERLLNYVYQIHGITIFYAESIDKLGDNLREVHPEMFCAVPRVLEKSFDKIMAKGRSLTGIKRMLFFWAVNLGSKYEPWKKFGWWYRFRLKIANKLIFSKWREAFGGKLSVVVSGGATLQSRLARIFWAAGIKIMEGYGMTETSPVIAVSNFLPGGSKVGTVGPVLPGVEMKFAEDGEILTRGDCVMKGYYKKPEATKNVIDKDGWFHTGDVGHLEDGKYVRITDRKKEIFKTSGGKYIAPQVLENKFKESSFIENIMVVGENKNFAAALVIPNFDHIKSWCKVKNHPFESNEVATQDQRIVDRIQREIDEINAGLDKVEQIKKTVLLNKPWSVADGSLGQTLKLRRNVLHERYAEVIEAIYSQ
jgi:long-chain acyl-CoA synthetase